MPNFTADNTICGYSIDTEQSTLVRCQRKLVINIALSINFSNWSLTFYLLLRHRFFAVCSQSFHLFSFFARQLKILTQNSLTSICICPTFEAYEPAETDNNFLFFLKQASRKNVWNFNNWDQISKIVLDTTP